MSRWFPSARICDVLMTIYDIGPNQLPHLCLARLLQLTYQGPVSPAGATQMIPPRYLSPPACPLPPRHSRNIQCNNRKCSRPLAPAAPPRPLFQILCQNETLPLPSSQMPPQRILQHQALRCKSLRKAKGREICAGFPATLRDPMIRTAVKQERKTETLI